jgi:formylglycine-generating enzyme required for sulfatase activity
MKQPINGMNYKEPLSGIEFIWIPGGSFEMGGWDDQAFDNEKPLHSVTLDGYWLGKYPVTQGQWKKVMGDNPSYFKKGDDYPVETVSWDECQKFIEKIKDFSGIKCSLPTEAQWEYAARSGSRRKLFAGGDNLNILGWHDGNAGDSTHPVGKKRANGLGLYDMNGNVFEWCNDRYGRDYYKNSPEHNPLGPSSGSDRVIRGGSWDFEAMFCRSTARDCSEIYGADCALGFRLVVCQNKT